MTLSEPVWSGPEIAFWRRTLLPLAVVMFNVKMTVDGNGCRGVVGDGEIPVRTQAFDPDSYQSYHQRITVNVAYAARRVITGC